MNKELGNNTLGRRIRSCAEAVGSGDELSRITGISRRTLENYLSGSSEPKASGLLTIAKAASVTLDWLVTGEGPKKREVAGSVQATSFITIPRVDIQLAAGTGSLNGDNIEKLEDIPFTKSFLGGKLGRLSAEGLIILTADGDSMDPLIADGDLVMVDKKRNTLSDGVYAFVYGGLARVKRLRPTIQGDVELISQNPEYKDELLKRADLEDFHIIGKVVWCGHRFT
ncbi:XRE family transcriptional regulator [Pseudovibrio sp. Ad37]|uniref:XRE family transcriptional regulator n=1 Tax=Pseudovibrio sp. Ad37 TaxID=989422 RepID=UPI0007AECA4B|nr:XRE family transcriptional regulator [Pseudovibrio sp. Ad37]KZL17852.1 putative HTH-type transcriptional regulator [Pseudovibrio sp. Ad37]